MMTAVIIARRLGALIPLTLLCLAFGVIALTMVLRPTQARERMVERVFDAFIRMCYAVLGINEYEAQK